VAMTKPRAMDRGHESDRGRRRIENAAAPSDRPGLALTLRALPTSRWRPRAVDRRQWLRVQLAHAFPIAVSRARSRSTTRPCNTVQ
jgi:hypothetical protein